MCALTSRGPAPGVQFQSHGCRGAPGLGCAHHEGIDQCDHAGPAHIGSILGDLQACLKLQYKARKPAERPGLLPVLGQLGSEANHGREHGVA